jgi:hypothetical protein
MIWKTFELACPLVLSLKAMQFATESGTPGM